jgi:hypothetical protein
LKYRQRHLTIRQQLSIIASAFKQTAGVNQPSGVLYALFASGIASDASGIT